MKSSTKSIFQVLGVIISMAVVLFLTFPLIALWTGHLDLIMRYNIAPFVFGCWISVSGLIVFVLPYTLIGILVNNYFTYDDKTRGNASFIGAVWIVAVPFMVISSAVNRILPPAPVTPR